MTIVIITVAIIAVIVAFASGCIVGSRFMLSTFEKEMHK